MIIFDTRRCLGLIATLLLCSLALPSQAAHPLKLPKIFSNNMVLQRDIPLPIWGWAEPGVDITVSFGDQEKTTKAGPDGKWRVTLTKLKANAKGSNLKVVAGPKVFIARNVVVGEVWICSGQSNMEWTLNSTHNAKEAIAAANYPLIRHFKVSHRISTSPQTDVEGKWERCLPTTAPKFTAVGYHFGRELHEKLEVPIGLLNTSWGGTRIEPWTDPSGFKLSPGLAEISDLVENADKNYRNAQIARLDDIEQWLKQSREDLKKGAEITPVPAWPKHPLNGNRSPTAIYNAMVAPIIPFGMRGVIWYQGESNNGEGMLYAEKMKALIGSWRKLWGTGDFPFLYVQLAPYRYNRSKALPGIWEAQASALSITNTGMAVITDIGNVADIHPRNKQEVGRRLSLWALNKTYGYSDYAYSGPIFKSMEIFRNFVTLKFDHAKGLKSSDGKPLTWFRLAAKDKIWMPAEARIVEDKLVLTSAIDMPVAVRFGWDELAEPNLVNGAGLPASPFRSDKW